MRTLTVNTAAGMVSNSNEPVIRISVAWSNYAYTNYTSREDDGTRVPSVLSFSGVSQTTKKDNASAYSQVSFELDDYDGTIKSVFDVGNLDGADVTVFYFFHDKTGSTGLKVFEGEIAGDIKWNEGKRTLNATAKSRIFSNRIGFATEDGQFGVNNDVAIGKVWPLVFGKAAHVPAVLVEREPNTELKYQFTLGDYGGEEIYDIIDGTDGYKKLSLEDRRELTALRSTNDDGDVVEVPSRIYLEDGSGFTQDEVISIEIEGVIFKGTIDSSDPDVFEVEEVNAPKYMEVAFAARDGSDPDSDNPRVAWLADNTQSVENSFFYFKRSDGNTNMHFFDNEGRNDNDLIRVTKCVRQLGTKIWLDNPIPSDEFLFLQDSDSFTLIDDTNEAFEVRGLNLSGMKIEITNALNIASGLLARKTIRRDEAAEVPYGSIIEHLKDAKFIKNIKFEGEPGAKVRQWDSKADIYIANAAESNSVTGVYGVRRVNGKQRFMPIPRSYYTINLNKATSTQAQNLGAPANVTTVEFDQPLSTFKNQDWSDEIYVTVNSTLSDNTATQIEYILNNYTNLSPNSSSFSAAASTLSNKPSNWALLIEKDALQLAEQMAWQCASALLYDDTQVKIEVLQEKPSSVKPINQSNVLFGTAQMHSTRKTDLFTAFKGMYRETYRPKTESDERDNKRYVHYRNNIDQFGYILKETDFFIYNNKEAVQNTLNFWGWRLSNIWKYISVKTDHTTLLVESFDGVDVSFTDSNILSGQTLRGVVESSKINMNDNTMQFNIWLPAIQGTISESGSAWQSVLGSTPDNPADKIKQYDYDVRLPELENDVDDWQRRLDALSRGITEKARVTAVQVITDDGETTVDQIKVDIYADGDTAGATEVEQVAAHLNVSTDAVVGQEVAITRDSNGRIISAMPPAAALLYVEITANNDDYLVCKVIDLGGADLKDENGDNVVINVAKPWDLRQDTVDGQTYTLYGTDWTINYTATDERTLTDEDGNEEDQRVTPPYFIGARLHVQNYGQYLSNLTVDIGGDSTPLEWIDINNSGRQWALKFEEE